MWFLHEGTGYDLWCLAHGKLAWLFIEPDTGLDHCPRILLSCFRARTSASDRQASEKLAVSYEPLAQFNGESPFTNSMPFQDQTVHGQGQAEGQCVKFYMSNLNPKPRVQFMRRTSVLPHVKEVLTLLVLPVLFIFIFPSFSLKMSRFP